MFYTFWEVHCSNSFHCQVLPRYSLPMIRAHTIRIIDFTNNWSRIFCMSLDILFIWKYLFHLLPIIHDIIKKIFNIYKSKQTYLLKYFLPISQYFAGVFFRIILYPSSLCTFHHTLRSIILHTITLHNISPFNIDPTRNSQTGYQPLTIIYSVQSTGLSVQ